MSDSRHFDKPDLTSAGKFIGVGDRNFYIPAYQRPFSWDAEKINRFFEDVVDDIDHRMIPERERGEHDADTVSFIGSVLCYENTNPKDIHPQVKNQVPQGVLSVIDGQQRLTVLIMTSIRLHDYLRTRKNDLPEGWLKNKCIELMENLANNFRTIRAVGDTRIYPKMIRAFADQWSTNKEGADADSPKYLSPLSNFSFSYGKFIRENPDNVKKFPYSHGKNIQDEDLKKDYAAFERADKLIAKNIDEICRDDQGRDDAGSFSQIQSIFSQNNGILNNLFNASDSSEIVIDMENLLEWQMTRALLLSSYIMKKVYFVCLVTKDENYAFDIFDSLNTTGELLTAYETFKPSVIRQEGVGDFRDSISKNYTDSIEKYLNSISVAKKQKATQELLITFALAETGKNLSKKLHEQRKYLIESYRNKEEGDKLLFIKHLMHASNVWDTFWKDCERTKIINALGIDERDDVVDEIECARFCLRFLVSSNHTICLALITRFYASIQDAESGEERIQKTKELCGAIKAIAAFFAIWRHSRETTEGIDNLYRKIMKDGAGGELMKFNRVGAETPPKLDDLRKSFCWFLKKHGGSSKTCITSVDAWVEESQKVPVFRTARTVAKFVLLTASHNTTPDEENPGCIKKGRADAFPSLMLATVWDGEDYETLEHICPRSLAKDPSNNVHVDTLHRIGNLTIIPRTSNSILSDRGWDEKRKIFRFLSSETLDELAKAKRDLPKNISQAAVDALNKQRYLPLTKALAQMDGFSYENPSDITKRGENILRNSWTVLAEWLNFDDN